MWKTSLALRLVWRVKIAQIFPRKFAYNRNKIIYLSVLKMTSSTPLHLPQQCAEIIAADSELEQAWESVNVWCERFMRCDDEREKKQELRRVAAHIQLACRFMSIRLKEFIQAQAENSLAKASALKTLRQVHVVSKWVSGHSIRSWDEADLWLAADRGLSCGARILSVGPDFLLEASRRCCTASL